MIGRLKTVVLDAADMQAEARFWSEVLDVPVVHTDTDWTTLEGRGVRLAVQLAPDHVPPQWPDPAHLQQLDPRLSWTTSTGGTAGPGARRSWTQHGRTPGTPRSAPTLPGTRPAWC